MTKILLVEDDKSLREIYGVRLLAEGYDIVSAGDGEEALAMAIKEKPELIISDVMMPKISGFDMLDILRSTTETRDIKVIMMTALSSDDQRARGEQLGADKYLVKSQVGIEDVVRTVHEVLGDGGKVAVPATQDGAAAPAADAPAPAEEAPVPADAPAEPAEEAIPAADTPSDTVEPAQSDTPAEEASADPAADVSAPTETPAEPVTPVSSDEAGPLPPQPTEIESTLPQPTAPFSSPAPANLGEQIVHPDTGEAPTPAVDTPAPSVESDAPSSDQVNTELTAQADPVSTQVDTPESVPAPAPDVNSSSVVSHFGESPAPEAPVTPDVPVAGTEGDQSPSTPNQPTPPAAPGV